MTREYIIKAFVLIAAIMAVITIIVPASVMKAKWKIVMNVAAGWLTVWWLIKVL